MEYGTKVCGVLTSEKEKFDTVSMLSRAFKMKQRSQFCLEPGDLPFAARSTPHHATAAERRLRF